LVLRLNYPTYDNRNYTSNLGSDTEKVLLMTFAVTETIQWKKQTLIAIVILITLYHNFVATTGSSSVIITAVSKVLLVSSIFMFINGILPEKMKVFGSKKID